MDTTWFTESPGKLLSAIRRIRLCDDRYPSQHQDQGPISVKDDGLPLGLALKARKSEHTRPRSGNRGSDNEGDAVAAPRLVETYS
jgi:hypothetical protein